MELFETTDGHLINPNNVEACKVVKIEWKKYLRFAFVSGNSIDVHCNGDDAVKKEAEGFREHVRMMDAFPIYSFNGSESNG
jgi:hypothetical protein